MSVISSPRQVSRLLGQSGSQPARLRRSDRHPRAVRRRALERHRGGASNHRWAIFELVTISTGLLALSDEQVPRWICIIAAVGGFLGYGVTQVARLVIGLISLAQVAQDGNKIFDLWLTVAIGTLATVQALTVNINDYAYFLYLIGAVFIPMSGALIAARLRTRGESGTSRAPRLSAPACSPRG